MNDIKIPKINQPIMALLIGLAGLGFAEYFSLKTLYWVSFIYTIPTAIIGAITIAIYMIRYAKKKP